MKTIARFISAAVLCLAFSAAAGAQQKLFHFGVKAGVNMTTLDLKGGLDSGNSFKDNLGYQAGVALQFDLPLWFSVEPDILFNLNGSLDKKYTDKDDNPRTQGIASIMVPLNIQWGPKFSDDNVRVFLQASPFIGYAISKDFRGNVIDPKEGTRETFDWNNFNRFQYGASVGLGVKAFAFQVSAEVFKNLGSITTEDGKNNVKISEIFKGNNFTGFRVNLAIIF